MPNAADRPWAILAFDHRPPAFTSVRPSGMHAEEIRQSKALIFDGFLRAVDLGLGQVRPGILVDEEYGADIATRAMSMGVEVSMPVERAASPVFTFEYGQEFGGHLLRFRPTFAKALVHHRTSDPPEKVHTQLERLRALSDFVREQSLALMIELIVGQRPDSDGIASVDVEALCASMAQMQGAGIQADLWKVEGISALDDAERVARQAGTATPPVQCVVLGSGASTDVVDRWLGVAATTDGFSGFAIGRSIWGGPVTAWLDGAVSRDDAIDQIASTYRSCTLGYTGSRVG